MEKAALVVKWSHDTNTGYIYRRGLGGFVDVEFKTAAAGWFYYRDHLPQLSDSEDIAKKTEKLVAAAAATDDDESDDDASLDQVLLRSLIYNLSESFAKMLGAEATRGEIEKKQDTMSEFSVGDVVKLHDDLGRVNHLQDGHGGFNPAMIKSLGKAGIVKKIDSDGDVYVHFGSDEWVLNPQLISKQNVDKTAQDQARATPEPKPKLKTGDKVVITKEFKEVKVKQQGHGGWDDDLEELSGTGVVGILRDVTVSNDLVVSFGDKTYILNTEICSEASKFKAPKQVRKVGMTRGKFSVGDHVKLDKDLDFVKREQKSYGKWDDAMKKAMTASAVVTEVRDDGGLRVNLAEYSWLVSPTICRLSKAEEVTSEMMIKLAKSHEVMRSWKMLGRYLDLEEPVLGQLEHSNKNNIEECIYQMLYTWRNQNSRQDATRQTLVKALRRLQFVRLAEDIQNFKE